MLIDAKGLDYAALNKLIKSSDDDCKIENCLGQRFIADGLAKRNTGQCTRRLPQRCANHRQRQCAGCGRRHNE